MTDKCLVLLTDCLGKKIHKSLFKTRNMTWSVVFYKSFIFEEKNPSFLKLLLQKEMYPYVVHYLV